jgi:ATP/maltotriose-dependent transcriptional regulator MalT
VAGFGALVGDPDRSMAAAGAWLEAERDLLIRAAQDAAERGWSDTGWRLIAALTNVAGNMSFLGQWVEAAEKILLLIPPGVGRAVLQLGLGGVYRLRGSQNEAAGMLRRARREFVRAGDEVFAATAATQLSAAARVRGDTRTAQAAVDWAIARLADGTVRPQLGWAFLVRGNLLRHIGAEPNAVWIALDAALSILRQAGDLPGQANARFSLAQQLREAGRPEEALEHFVVARDLMLAVEEDNTPALSALDGAMGRLYLDRGDLVAAAAHGRDALVAARKLAQPYSLTQALTLSGEIARRRGDTSSALRLLAEAEALARGTAALTLLAPVRFEQAKVHAAQGDLPLARTVAEDARDAYAQSGRDETEVVEKWIADLPASE